MRQKSMNVLQERALRLLNAAHRRFGSGIVDVADHAVLGKRKAVLLHHVLAKLAPINKAVDGVDHLLVAGQLQQRLAPVFLADALRELVMLRIPRDFQRILQGGGLLGCERRCQYE